MDSGGRPILLAARYEFLPGEIRSLPGWATRLVARLTPTGDLDPSFGAGAGIAILDSYRNRGLAIPSSDEPLLVWGGYSSTSLVTRLGVNGAVLTDYGTAGTRAIDGGGGEAVFDRFGRLLVLESPRRDVGRLLRLRANRSIDRTFGQAGLATVRLPTAAPG